MPVILSIIIFHAIPILYYKNFFLKNIITKENFYIIFFSAIIAIILIINFNYRIDFTGGGFFLHLSNFLFKNNYLFLAMIGFFVFFSLKLIKIDFKQNLLLFIILILMVPQFSVYHKYYDPLLIILFFTTFNLGINKSYFSKNNLIILYIFNFIYFMLTFVNSYYIKF